MSLGPPPERKTSKEPARGVSPNYFAADNLIVTLRLGGGGGGGGGGEGGHGL